MDRYLAVRWLSLLGLVLLVCGLSLPPVWAIDVIITGTGSSGGHTLFEETTALPAQPNLRLLGAGATCVNNAGESATDCTFPSDVTTTSPQVLENKAVPPRVCSDPGTTPTLSINADSCDVVDVATLAQNLTILAPTGALIKPHQRLTVVVLTAVQRTLTWTTGAGGFSDENGLLLPALTKAAGRIELGFAWNPATTTWVLRASSFTTAPGTAAFCLRSNGPGVEPSWQACVGAGSIHLNMGAPFPPPTNMATPDLSENNIRLLFDAVTPECALWQFRVPPDYGGSPVLKWQYSMTSATSGGMHLDVDLMAVAPGTAVDVNTDSYGGVNHCDVAAVPATAGFPAELSCPLTLNDGLAAGYFGKIRVCRAAADGGDTAAGDMEGIAGMIEYTRQ